jgi:hypothetical protein
MLYLPATGLRRPANYSLRICVTLARNSFAETSELFADALRILARNWVAEINKMLAEALRILAHHLVAETSELLAEAWGYYCPQLGCGDQRIAR